MGGPSTVRNDDRLHDDHRHDDDHLPHSHRSKGHVHVPSPRVHVLLFVPPTGNYSHVLIHALSVVVLSRSRCFQSHCLQLHHHYHQRLLLLYCHHWLVATIVHCHHWLAAVVRNAVALSLSSQGHRYRARDRRTCLQKGSDSGMVR